MTDHVLDCSDKMSVSGSSCSSSCKRSLDDSTSDAPPPKRRILYAKSVDKWISDYDKQLNTTTWLKYSVVDRVLVESMKCSVCSKFNNKLIGMRNYSSAFIDGSRNLRISSFKDHAASAMHLRAMNLLKKEQGVDICEYAPIAKAISTMDETAREISKKKFDIAYMIAKEKLPFTKMKPFYRSS